MRRIGQYTARAAEYIDNVDARMANMKPKAIAKRVIEITNSHENWRNITAISLNAAESVISRQARRLLDSDLCTRVTEGFPGDKDFPAHRQNRYIDEIEAIIIHLLRRMFHAEHIEWRPVSTSMANATVFFSLTKPGALLMSQPEPAGGNYSYNQNGPPRAAGLKLKPLPCVEETFEIDVERAVDSIAKERPAIIAFGGSNVLFPYPVAELRNAADQVGAVLLYDAAHVGLLIATGLFQDPIVEGAHVVTMSSHKIMSGPVGGFILTDSDKLAQSILSYSFPTFIQTRDQNKYAAAAYALAEMTEFGHEYAQRQVSNARELGRALESEGFRVLCADRGYTETHQIFMLLDDADANDFEDICQAANLLVTKAQRMGKRDVAAGRLTTQEITRRGMREQDMPVIARWMRRLIKDRETPEIVAAEIAEFLQNFQVLRYTFDHS